MWSRNRSYRRGMKDCNKHVCNVNMTTPPNIPVTSHDTLIAIVTAEIVVCRLGCLCVSYFSCYHGPREIGKHIIVLLLYITVSKYG